MAESKAQQGRITKAIKGFAGWWDCQAIEPPADGEPVSRNIEWIRCVPFFSLHFACIALIWVGWSWPAVATAVFMYFFRMFAITGFYHRYFSHRTFKTNRFWQFVFAVWGNLAVQRGPLWWAAHHRHHHRHSDKEPDAHSPIVHDFLWSHIFWITSASNFSTRMKEVKDLAKFPELCFIDRYDTLVPIAYALVMLAWGWFLEGIMPGTGVGPWQMLIWGFFVSTVFLFHGTCTINSLSHLFGTRRYETTDHSRNNFILALITMGEGWHNNHHHYPASARQGFFWWEVDITYYILKLFSFVGIVSDLRPVPDHIRDGRPNAAGETVES